MLANNKVYVNGQMARVTAAAATSLTIVVPRASSGKVTVETVNGVGISPADLVVPPSANTVAQVSLATRVTLPAVGQSAPHTVSGTGGKVSLVLFDMTSAQEASAIVTAASAGGGSVIVYAPNGSQLASGSLSNNAYAGTTGFGAAGTYTIALAPSGSGSETFTLYSVPPDASATITANGTKLSLATTVPSQNLTLTFSANAGDRVALATYGVNSNTCWNPGGLIILAPDGHTQVFSSPSQCVTTTSAAFNGAWTLPSTGTYTIKLAPVQPITGTFGFTLYSVPSDASATTSENGTKVSLTTTVPAQNMTLTFSGDTGDRINLLTAPASGDPCWSANGLTIVAPDGQTQVYANTSLVCAASASPSITGVLVLPSTGTYTIHLAMNQPFTGTVGFTLYSVPPDATATISENGTKVNETVTAPGQNMHLTFSGTAGDRVNLVTGPASSLVCWAVNALNVIAPDGLTSVYSSPSSCYSSSGPSVTGVLVLPSTGTYTINLAVNQPYTGTIGFTLYTVPPDATGTITTDGTKVNLTTTAPGQKLVLTFSGTAGSKVNLVTTPASGSPCWNSGGLTLTAPDGTTQVYSSPSQCVASASPAYSGILVLPTTGTYTIKLTPNQPFVGTFGFSLYILPASASATMTEGGGAVSLTTTAPGQTFQLQFSETAGDRVSLLTAPSSASGTACIPTGGLNIVAPDGTTKPYSSASVCISSGSPTFTGAVSLPSTGTYTINLLAGNWMGTVFFTLYSVPPDATGTVTVGGSPISLVVMAPGQAARASYSGVSGQNNTIAVTAQAGGCYTIKTLEPDGVTVLRGDSHCGASYLSGSLAIPTTGTYTVVVTPSGTATDTYTVGVTTP